MRFYVSYRGFFKQLCDGIPTYSDFMIHINYTIAVDMMALVCIPYNEMHGRIHKFGKVSFNQSWCCID